MALKPPAVATYYVNLWLEEDCLRMKHPKDRLIKIAEEHHYHSFADPKLLFPERPDLRTGDIVFIFDGCKNTSNFIKDTSPLEYIVEAKYGRLE